MEPKEIIELAIKKAEKKYLPHFYTDYKEAHNIYKIFQKNILEYYSRLLENKNIAKIKKNDEDNENFYDFQNFFLATNIKKHSTLNDVLKIGQIYYKDKKAHNGELDIIINNIIDYGKEFILEIENEIIATNAKKSKHEEHSIKETLLMKQSSEFSLDNPILPLSKIKNIEKYQNITGQNTILSIGQVSNDNINHWIYILCEAIPKAMHSIGFKSNAITLNRNLDFFYNNHQIFLPQKAFIHHNSNSITETADPRLYVAFNHTYENPETALLHEWTHGLDILLAREFGDNNQFISSLFMNGDTIINKDHKLKEIFDLGDNLFSLILANMSSEDYQAKKKEEIIKYKEFSQQIIGESISANKEDWDNLSQEDKYKITSLPIFKKTTQTAIECLRKKDETAIRAIGKNLHAIISTEKYKEVFPHIKHLTLTSRSAKVLYQTRNYALDNSISWFRTQNKKGYKENYALTYTDFSKMSSTRGILSSKEYLFKPHEMFARVIQMFTVEPKCYLKSKHPKGVMKLKDDSQLAINVSLNPELNFQTKHNALSLIHEMAKSINIQPEKTVKEIMANIQYLSLQADRINQQRGDLSNDSLFLYKIKNLNNNEIKKCEETITKRQKKTII